MQTSALLNRFSTYFYADSESGLSQSGTDNSQRLRPTLKFKKIRRIIRNSKSLPFIIVGVIVVIIIILALSTISGRAVNSTVSGSSDNRVAIKPALKSQQINKTFGFSLKDSTGKEVSKLKYEIQSAEIRDEIVVKGQLATAVKGRQFLIINLKITNSYDKTVQVNARDYLRLIINNSPEKLAPDIHNDPVEVQAISTKLTRVGFPINDTDKNLDLQVGEIDGAKQTIKLDLK